MNGREPNRRRGPSNATEASSDMEGIFAAGGEMGRLMASIDWSHTPIGAVASWPQSLRTAISICLQSRFPMLIWWGPDLVNIYNDDYRPLIGEKHPGSMGLSGRECWPEIWHIIGPSLEGVLARGEATWSEDQLLLLERNGYAEECYFTFSYSPIRDEEGGVGGVFTAVTETTQRVLAERRLRMLRELAEISAQGGTAQEACKAAAAAIAGDAADMPFALLYLVSEDRTNARLVGAAGIEPEATVAGATVELGAGEDIWSLKGVADTGVPAVVESVPSELLLGTEEIGFGTVEKAIVLPINDPGENLPPGLLVAGLSPLRPLEGDYRSFLDLIADHVGTAITEARAYEFERKRAEALAELDRAKTAFFSNVSHEFRTPITLLLGPIEEVLADASEPLAPGQREHIDTAYRNALRLMKLVNSLLDFSRIEAGRVEAVYEPTDLATLTAELASAFRSAIERANITLAVDCGPIGEDVFIDREMWEKIVFNLLSNAFKFTFEGEIGVTVRRSGDSAELAVTDTGVGIAPEHIPNLFQRFNRIQGAKGRTFEGSGIGLALVEELAKLHGGALEVASELGGGSTFTLSIPLGWGHLPSEKIQAKRTIAPFSGAAPYLQEVRSWCQEESPREGLADANAGSLGARVADADLAEVAGNTKGAHVLVADDNADMRKYLVRLLSTWWSVEPVADGEAALVAARDRVPDLVLTDVMMPGLDGFELLGALRADERTKHVPVVLLSARAGEESAVEGLEAGADDYVIKPFSAGELVARVRTNLELGRTRLESARLESAQEASLWRDDLIAGVSHSMQTPLATIFGLAEGLEQGPALSDGQRSSAYRAMMRQATNLHSLVQHFLDYSRLEAGRELEVQLRATDIGAVARRAADLSSESNRISITVPEGLERVRADEERLMQVLINLLSNALKFSAPGSPVWIVVRDTGQDMEVDVVDRGVGLATEDLEKVFQRFHRAHRTNGIGGSGFGLYISKALIEAQGGSISATSRFGEGSRFTISLPKAFEGPGSSGRILVVDDEEDIRFMARLQLQGDGWTVEETTSGEDALDRCRNESFDLVVLDQKMLGATGMEVARTLRTEGFEQPIIIFSGYLDSKMEAQAASMGLTILAKADVGSLKEKVASLQE